MVKKLFGRFLVATTTLWVVNLPLVALANEQEDIQKRAKNAFNKLSYEEKVGQLLAYVVDSLYTDSQQQKILADVADYSPGIIYFKNAKPSLMKATIARARAVSQHPLMAAFAVDDLLNLLGPGMTDFDAQTASSMTNMPLLRQASRHQGAILASWGIDIVVGDWIGKSYDRHFSDAYPFAYPKAREVIRGLADVGISCWALPDREDLQEDYPIQLIPELKIEAIPSQMLFQGAGDISEMKEKELDERYETSVLNDHLFVQQSPVDLVKAILHHTDVLFINRQYGEARKVVLEHFKKRKQQRHHIDDKVMRVLTKNYANGALRTREYKVDYKILKRRYLESTILVAANRLSYLPIVELDNRQFASLGIDLPDSSHFQSSLNHYNYFTHFTWPEHAVDVDRLLYRLGHYDDIVVGFNLGTYATQSPQRFMKVLASLQQLNERANVIIILFGEQRWLQHFEDFYQVLHLHHYLPEFAQLAPQVVFGAVPTDAKLAYNVSDIFSRGSGSPTTSLQRLQYTFPQDAGLSKDLEQKVDEVVASAIDMRAIPGGQVLVAKNGKVVLEKGYGYYTYDSIFPVEVGSIYDIASVTKVAATLQVTMFLAEHGRLQLDREIANYLPELQGTNKEHLVVSDILRHQSGLRSFIPFFRMALAADRINPSFQSLVDVNNYSSSLYENGQIFHMVEDSVWAWTVRSDLRKNADGGPYNYRYSDLGFFMMKRLNETLTNQRQSEFLAQNFYEPLGLRTMCFKPLCRFPIERMVPTENDYKFRKSLVWGTVHDPNAALVGGEGGHAGLFANANDLAILLQMNLQGGQYGGTRYLHRPTLDQFTRDYQDDNRRGLGWDKPDGANDGYNVSKYSSSETFGHLGFTGTAVWVDPKEELIFIFLSNRIYPEASNTKLIEKNIRTKVLDAVYKSIIEEEPTP